jgi:hypothetical protein
LCVNKGKQHIRIRNPTEQYPYCHVSENTRIPDDPTSIESSREMWNNCGYSDGRENFISFKVRMGGRKDYSAVDALINISTPMSQSLRRREKFTNQKSKNRKTLPRPSLLIHDIDGAFNNTGPEVLIQIMEQRQLPSYMTLWVKEFITDRKLVFGFNAKSEDPKPLDRALPQGSPISPILFAITACAIFENEKQGNQSIQK